MIPQLYLLAGAAAISFAAGGGLAWKYQGARLETCALAKQNLSASLSEQNARVEHLEQISDKARADAEAAYAKGRTEQAAASARIATRNAKPAPNSCDAAMALTDAE
jgi:hypothetical protein